MLTSLHFIFVSTLLVLFYCNILLHKLNNVQNTYFVQCDFGLYVFENQYLINNQSLHLVDLIMDEIRKCPSSQFTNDTNYIDKWTSQPYNNTHQVCVINLGKDGVSDETVYHLLLDHSMTGQGIGCHISNMC